MALIFEFMEVVLIFFSPSVAVWFGFQMSPTISRLKTLLQLVTLRMVSIFIIVICF